MDKTLRNMFIVGIGTNFKHMSNKKAHFFHFYGFWNVMLFSAYLAQNWFNLQTQRNWYKSDRQKKGKGIFSDIVFLAPKIINLFCLLYKMEKSKEKDCGQLNGGFKKFGVTAITSNSYNLLN